MKILVVMTFALVLLLPQVSFSEEQKQGDAAKGDSGHKVSRVFDDPPKQPLKDVPNIPKEYEGLVKVFDEYWTAVTKKDYDKAYTYESEEFRKTTGLDKYKASFGKDLIVKNVRALGVKKLQEKEVIVTGSMIYNTALPSPTTDHYKPLNDKWLLEGENWKHSRVVKK